MKFTILEFECANRTWMCSAPPTPLLRKSFPGSFRSNIGGRTGRVNVRGGVEAVEYARCLDNAMIGGSGEVLLQDDGLLL